MTLEKMGGCESASRIDSRIGILKLAKADPGRSPKI